MKFKACGLSRRIEVETCIENNVDFCGFILNYPKSHRFLPLNKAKVLTDLKKYNTKFVGVLVKPNEEELEIFSKLQLDYFQLYGDYSNQDILHIKNKYGRKIISSIQVKKKLDINNFKNIEKNSDIILWDSTGYEQSLDWDYNWLRGVSTNVEKMVAGNITIDKLKNLVNLADIVDVSGALETNKVKDIDKIKKFLKEIKEINNEN